MTKDVDLTLQDHLVAIVKGLGYDFVGYELLRQGRSSLLRIYIDNAPGINLDDCTKVSRQVSAMLDVEDPIQGEYTLEVSSPGLNRPLFELAHYENQIGQRIKVRLRVPYENKRNFSGMLQKVEGTKIYLIDNLQEIILDFSEIEKANVIADI